MPILEDTVQINELETTIMMTLASMPMTMRLDHLQVKQRSYKQKDKTFVTGYDIIDSRDNKLIINVNARWNQIRYHNSTRFTDNESKCYTQLASDLSQLLNYKNTPYL